MSFALGVVRIPPTPEAQFHCVYYRCTMAGQACLERQGTRAKPNVNAKDQTPRVPARFQFCASGQCKQGNEIRQALRGSTTKAAPYGIARGRLIEDAEEKRAAHTAAGKALVAAVEARLAPGALVVTDVQQVKARQEGGATWEQFQQRKAAERAAALPANEKKAPISSLPAPERKPLTQPAPRAPEEKTMGRHSKLHDVSDPDVRAAWEKHGSINRVADHFGVSHGAATGRLTKMGLGPVATRKAARAAKPAPAAKKHVAPTRAPSVAPSPSGPYAAVLADLEAKRAQLDVAIAAIRALA